jgi:hypothetical protein
VHAQVDPCAFSIWDDRPEAIDHLPVVCLPLRLRLGLLKATAHHDPFDPQPGVGLDKGPQPAQLARVLDRAIDPSPARREAGDRDSPLPGCRDKSFDLCVHRVGKEVDLVDAHLLLDRQCILKAWFGKLVYEPNPHTVPGVLT